MPPVVRAENAAAGKISVPPCPVQASAFRSARGRVYKPLSSPKPLSVIMFLNSSHHLVINYGVTASETQCQRARYVTALRPLAQSSSGLQRCHSETDGRLGGTRTSLPGGGGGGVSCCGELLQEAWTELHRSPAVGVSCSSAAVRRDGRAPVRADSGTQGPVGSARAWFRSTGTVLYFRSLCRRRCRLFAAGAAISASHGRRRAAGARWGLFQD